MNSIFFSNKFAFNDIRMCKYHYTDNRRGCPLHYVAYMKKGRSVIKSPDRTIEISAGDVFYIPYGLSYQSYWYGNDEIDFISLGFIYFPDFDDKKFTLQVIDCPGEIKKLILEMPLAARADVELLGRFYTTLSHLTGYMKFEEKDKDSRIVCMAERFLSESPDARVGEIARHCHVSTSALYHIFKKTSDITPNGMRQRLLCTKAALMLTTTDRSVEDISIELGFSSASYFRKIMKKYTGQTPSGIRKNTVLQ